MLKPFFGSLSYVIEPQIALFFIAFNGGFTRIKPKHFFGGGLIGWGLALLSTVHHSQNVFL